MENNQILALLKKYRMEKSPSAPYKVFSNAMLESILKEKPKSLNALKNIKGFPEGGIRIQKYGEDIIKIFRNEYEVGNLSKF